MLNLKKVIEDNFCIYPFVVLFSSNAVSFMISLMKNVASVKFIIF